MTTPASTEQLLAAWRELEAERERRFKEKLDAGEAIRVRAWASERKSDYSGRRLPHPDDAWMA